MVFYSVQYENEISFNLLAKEYMKSIVLKPNRILFQCSTFAITDSKHQK